MQDLRERAVGTRARSRAIYAGIVVFVGLVAGCAAVPGADDDIVVGPGAPGQPVVQSTVPPPAEGPARPSWGCTATPDLTPFDGSRPIGVGGQQRSMLVHVPPNLVAGQPAPLVVDFHGIGTNAELQSNVTRWNAVADRDGFVVVHPQGLNTVWNFATDEKNPDIAYVRAVVLALMSERCIDVSRVYATGLSMGALMSSTLACMAPDVFAAVGVVAGFQFKPECEPAKPRPAIVFWGSKDCVMPWYGTLGPCLAIGAPGRTQPTAPVPPDQDGGFPPIGTVLANWAAHNGCTGDPQTAQVSAAVTHRVYQGCQPTAGLELYFIEGGSHSWPGSEVMLNLDVSNPGSGSGGRTTREIDATALIWEFFRRYQLS